MPSQLLSHRNRWSAEQAADEDQKGPTCWKCKGACYIPLFVKKQKQKRPRINIKSSGAVNVDVDQQSKNTSTSTSTTDSSTSDKQEHRTCPVCKGAGHLPIRSKFLNSQKECGAITSRRRRPRGWMEFGHIPPAVQATLAVGVSNELMMDEKTSDGTNTEGSDTNTNNPVHNCAISLLAKANGRDDDYDTKRHDVPVDTKSFSSGDPRTQQQISVPKWLPINPGEQLCNLVGRWRIVQRVASHRWTTDDLVTAYVGASTYVKSQQQTQNNAGENKKKKTIRYLDLGTGNASVLQMASWYLLSTLSKDQYALEAVGVEARSEAIGLARRSLSFNLGNVEYNGTAFTGGLGTSATQNKEDVPMDTHVQIVLGDFRNLVSLSTTATSTNNEKADDEPKSMEHVASQRYDLITGTPPYFRVGFKSSKGTSTSSDANKQPLGSEINGNNDEAITSAVIEQGGMPTSMQSAPARCEFRGGVEAYCLTASAMLADHGMFAVCENWLNDNRVWKGAAEAGLEIVEVWPVMGGAKKEHNLFAVYVMRKKQEGGVAEEGSTDGSNMNKGVVRPSLVVRDEHGQWTEEYSKVLEAMSIPTV